MFFDNGIFKIKNLLTSEECESIINLHKCNQHQDKREFYSATYINPSEYSWSPKLFSGIDSWKKRYPYLDSMIYRWKLYSPANIQSYEPNQYYNAVHCEHTPNDIDSLKRIGVWMIYLNTIKEGGGTEFRQQKVNLKARQGDFYIWTSSWTHPHKGILAPNESKYILTGWINYV